MVGRIEPLGLRALHSLPYLPLPNLTLPGSSSDNCDMIVNVNMISFAHITVCGSKGQLSWSVGRPS